MKKTLPLKNMSLAFFFFLLMGVIGMGRMSAQNFYYDFEQCNVGDKVAETLGEPWTTWDLTPGGAKDAIITDEQCIGTRALKIDTGNDVVLRLCNKATGTYMVSFDMFVPEGKEAYFNLLHEFAGSNSTTFINVWFNSENNGNLINGLSMSYSNLVFPFDEWFRVDLEYYADDGILCFKINDEIVCLGKSFNSNLKLAGLDLWASSQNEDRNGFFIDNVSFEEVEGPFVPSLTAVTNTINAVLARDTIDDSSYYCELKNDGSAMMRCVSWIDYGVGEDGGDPITMHYDSDPYYYYGHYNNNPYIELGIKYYSYDLSENMMVGRKITGMQYYVPASFATGGSGPITFKLYKMIGFAANPLEVELITEKDVYNYDCGSWLTVEFDEPIPLRGFTLLAAVGFQQIGGGYPISLDAGPAVQYKGDLVRLDGDGWFSLNYNSVYYGGQEFGNHNIRLICEGQPVTSGWVTESYELWGEILCPEDDKTYGLTFNTAGLDYGEYEAVLHVEVNDHEDLELSIPINLKVSGADVGEISEDNGYVYPNPTSGFFRIEANDLRHVSVFNTVGQKVYDAPVDGDLFDCDLSQCDAGVYLIRIETAAGVTTKRVVLTK